MTMDHLPVSAQPQDLCTSCVLNIRNKSHRSFSAVRENFFSPIDVCQCRSSSFAVCFMSGQIMEMVRVLNRT